MRMMNKANLDKLFSDVYGINLYWWQRVALKMMWRYECTKEAVKQWIWLH